MEQRTENKISQNGFERVGDIINGDATKKEDVEKLMELMKWAVRKVKNKI